MGSGALFFDLATQGRLTNIPSTLIDSNADLIGTYLALARHPAKVILKLRDLARSHSSAGAAFYNEVRNQRFNPSRMKRGSRQDPNRYSVELAAQLLYHGRWVFGG